MTEYVALLRGLNGGQQQVPLAVLVEVADALGWGEAETFATSGNVLFTSAREAGELAGDYRAALAARGFDLLVSVCTAAQLRAMLAECPFTPATGSHVHGYVTFGMPRLDAGALARLRAGDEELVLTPRAAWLHAPAGPGRSALGRGIEEVLGIPATGRNLNTLRKLAELLDARPGR
ncbi:MAG: DUF1697 domain-containing protein [Rubellimicrobium sp.]|nr:DUF1697 domain-containing protein [Rubellimicrobium sp.]